MVFRRRLCIGEGLCYVERGVNILSTKKDIWGELVAGKGEGF